MICQPPHLEIGCGSPRGRKMSPQGPVHEQVGPAISIGTVISPNGSPFEIGLADA